jgi:hypothetical protein
MLPGASAAGSIAFNPLDTQMPQAGQMQCTVSQSQAQNVVPAAVHFDQPDLGDLCAFGSPQL